MGTIHTDIVGNSMVLTIDYPEFANGVCEENLSVFPEKFEEASSNENVDHIILRGSGAVFCLGGAASFLEELCSLDQKRRYESLRISQSWVRRILKSSKLVVAYADGLVAGFGVDLALSCDMILKSPRTVFSPSYNKLGLLPDGGGLLLLAHRIGPFAALEFFSSANEKCSEELGLARICNLEVSSDLSNEKLARKVRSEVRLSSMAFKYMKEELYKSWSVGFEEHLETIAMQQAELMGDPKFQFKLKQVGAFQRRMAKASIG